MPTLKTRPSKILKSYRLEQGIVEALAEEVRQSKNPVTETDVVTKHLKKGLGLK